MPVILLYYEAIVANLLRFRALGLQSPRSKASGSKRCSKRARRAFASSASLHLKILMSRALCASLSSCCLGIQAPAEAEA